MKKIMVTGATGQLGSQVLNLLVEKTGGNGISAIARDVTKLTEFSALGVNVVYGDYNDRNSLVKAFSGIDLLYFVSGSDVSSRLQQHENVVAAAREAGVKHVVYTSFQRRNETENSPVFLIAQAHLLTEKLLKESGLTYTILKHALYSDVVPMFIGSDVLEKGIIYQPAGDGKVAFTSRSDMAKAGVAVLTGEGHENKTYEIAGEKSYAYSDVAEILSKIGGKPVVYVSPTAEEFSKTLSEAGVLAEIIGMVGAFSEGIKQGEFDFPGTELEKLIGEKPEDLAGFLSKVYSK